MYGTLSRQLTPPFSSPGSSVQEEAEEKAKNDKRLKALKAMKF